MKKLFPHLLFAAFFFFLLPQLYAQSNQTVNNGQMTAPVNFTGGCTYTWTNNNPSIGLAPSGTGNIPAFTAVNAGSTAVSATITATPVSNGFAYISNFGDNTVSVINIATNQVVHTINVGYGPNYIAISPDGSRVFVEDNGEGFISDVFAIDATTNTTLARIQTPDEPSYGLAVSPDGNKLYIGCVGSASNGSVTVTNTSTFGEISSLSFNDMVFGIALSPDGSLLYVSNTFTNNIAIVDTKSNSVISNISLGYHAHEIALSPDGSKLYVCSMTSNNVTVINTVTKKITTVIPVGSSPYGITLSPDGSRVYIANQNSNTVSVINGLNDTFFTNIPVGINPCGVSVTPDGKYLYVVDEDSNNVLVLNTSNYQNVTTIPVGSYPSSVGNFISSGIGCSPVTFTITVNPTPTITTTAPTGTISACKGTPSADPNVEQFSVSGTGLTGNITVTPPSGFEISFNSNSGYGNLIGLFPINGSVANTIIYVRSGTSAPVGNVTNENVTLTSPGATTQTIALSGIIKPLPIVNTPSSQEVANGATTTPVNFTGTANTYTWSNNNTGIGLAASGTGNISAFTAVNTGSSKVTATITVTPSNAPLAYIENNGENSMSVINTATQKVINTVSFNTPDRNFSSYPNSIALSPDGQVVYVGEQASNHVIVYNTTTNSSVSIPISVPMGICVSPDNTKFYVASNIYRGVIYVYDVATNAPITTINVGNFPYGLAMSPDGSKLYVADSGNNYTSNAGSDNIDVISTSTNKVINTFPVNGYPDWMVISPDGNTLYATDTFLNNLYIINTTTGAITNTITMNFEPYAIAISPDGSRVYVANQISNNVSVISTSANQIITTINVGNQPAGISITPDGSELYVANNGLGTVSVINTANYSTTATIPVGKTPSSYGNFISPAGCPGAPVSFTITVDPAGIPNITCTTPTGTISACKGTPSADPNVEQFNASGSDLTGDITVTSPTGFEVSRDIGGPYNGSLTLTQTLGSVGNSVIFVRSAATAPAGSISGINVTLNSPGATDQTVALSGTIYSIPSANTPGSQTKINGQTTDPVNFTGDASSYTWVNNNTGIGLAASGTGNIPSFTAINNTGSPVIATLTVTPVNGSDCNGTPDEFYITVDPTPTVLTLAGSLNPLTTIYGTASAAESFTVSCSTIGAQILVTPPPGFEVSSDGTTFNSTVTITNKESNSPVTVYIRLAVSDHVKGYSGNIVISTANAANATITMPESVVTPAVLTITADNKTKPYGAADPPLTVSYSGFVNNDGPAQLTTLPVLTTIATAASAVGQYTINVSGASSPDYTPSYNAGLLTVTPSLSLQDIPNTFTPNGDGRNDTWVINGLEYYPAATVNIFNRWGQKLYNSLGYPVPWDGTYHGKGLPSGTYYFIIDLKNKQPKIAGWVAIVR